MKDEDFNKAILFAEGVLLKKGFLEPTKDLENFEEFVLDYQPVKYLAGFMSKKMDRATASGERFIFEIYVKGAGDPTYVEIFQRISADVIE